MDQSRRKLGMNRQGGGRGKRKEGSSESSDALFRVKSYENVKRYLTRLSIVLDPGRPSIVYVHVNYLG